MAPPLLKNIIIANTFFEKQKRTLIGFLLTNRPRSFLKTSIIEAGLSDHHKMILSIFHSNFARILLKTIEYKNYKTFHNNNVILDLDQEYFKGEMYTGKCEMFTYFHKRNQVSTWLDWL